MKKILFALILCFPITFFGQISTSSKGQSPRITKTIPAVYAEILVKSYSLEKQKVTINFGAKDERMVKQSKAAQSDFYSFIDAMNAMSIEGYELVDSYELVGEKVTELHFILMKEGVFPPRPPKPTTRKTTSTKKK